MAEHSFEIKIIVTTDDIVNLLACRSAALIIGRKFAGTKRIMKRHEIAFCIVERKIG